MDEPSDSTTVPSEASDRARLIGVISDTHGLLRSQVFEVFRGVRHILHAGDVGDPNILVDLSVLAPVTAVWGNMDGPDVRAVTEEARELVLFDTAISLIHGHQTLEHSGLGRHFPGAKVIIHGHTHTPANRNVGGVLVLNPGAAGPMRPGKPVTVALLRLSPDGPRARHIHLPAD
jgi:putative phosphoesterase